MPPRQILAIAVAVCALAQPCALQTPHSRHLTLAPARHAPDDLEVTGLVAGLPAAGSGYVSYAQLSSLPQVTVTVRNDSNFADQPAGTVQVTGVPLATLAKALGALPQSDLIDALCTDFYRSHYPADYVAAHHPIFALRINGERPDKWAAKTHQYDPGPYFITHANFVPRYKVLAHDEELQIPDNVMRLNFTTTAATYGPLTPPGDPAPDTPVAQGFAIAKQNCLRCHAMGQVGGTKSSRSWRGVGKVAAIQPDVFAKYVRNPKSVDPNAEMPANPGYDDATIAALSAYFRTFAATQEKPQQ